MLQCQSGRAFANHVTRTHVTTPEFTINYGFWWGKIGYSSTVNKQNKRNGIFYSYSDTGNNSVSYGVGIGEWYGIGVGASKDGNIFYEVQLSPYFHGGVSIGIDGFGYTYGIDVGNTAHDIEVKVGWGTVALIVFSCALKVPLPYRPPVVQ